MTKPINRAPKTVSYRRRRQAIECILNAIGPPATARMECLRVVVNAVRTIAKVAQDIPPGKLKSQFRAAGAALDKARKAIEGLPDADRRHLLPALDALIGELRLAK